MNSPRIVAAIAALCALGMGGCKSKAPADQPAAPAAKAAPPASKAPEAPAAKSAPAKTEVTVTTAPSSGDARVGPLVQERQILREKRDQLIRSYTEMGDNAFAESRFEDAKVAYGNVLDLDPKNEHAQRRLEQSGAILGERPMDERNALNTSVEEYQVRAQQAKVTVANLAGQADQHAKNGDYEGAAALLDQAMVIVGLYPSNVAFSPSPEGLKRLHDAAKKNAEAAAEVRRRTIFKEASDQTALEATRQRKAKEERKSVLFQKANEAMERHDYETARNFSEEILADDPQNDEAKRLRRIALDAGNEQTTEDQRRLILDEWKHVFEQLGEAYTPQSADYTFPDTWSEIQAKRTPPVLSTAAKMQEDPQNREVRNRLENTRTTVQFHETRLADAVEYLHRISGVNIIIMKEATEGKSDADLTIEKLDLDQPVRISEILKLITEFRGLAWTIENGVVQITTPAAAQGAAVVQLYDVKDLATPITNFPGDDFNLDPKGEHNEKEEPKEPQPEFVLDQIGELITTNVDKSVWEAGGSVEPVPPGTLVIKCPPATHAKVQQLLDGLRGAGGLQVSIETRFVTVQDNFLEEVGVDLRGLGDNTGGVGIPGKGGLRGTGGVTTPVTFDDVFFGSQINPTGSALGATGGTTSMGTGNDVGVYYQIQGRGDDIRARFQNLYDVSFGKPGVLTNAGGLTFQGTMIDDTQLEVILRAVQKSDRSTVVTAPRLTAYNGQRANVQVLNQQSYISDFDVEIAQASQIGDPIVQTLRDGVILDLRPVVSADRRYITMELRPTVAILTRPIGTFQTTLANGPPVTIQLPELAVSRVRTTVTMPDGGTLLLGGLRYFQEQRLDATVPLLDKIPLASFFFSRKGTYLEKRNILVLIRARILRPEENEPGTGRKM